MPECKSYTYEVTEKSPLHPLVLAMKADGITDAGRDMGYAQIDYSAPWKPAKTDGAGDCFVDEREDLERGLEKWKKYRKELAGYYETDYLMWEIADAAPNPKEKGSKPKDEPLLASVRRAIAEIRNELEGQKLDPTSDEYRQKMADALFYFYEFPSRSRWASYDGGQKKEVLARMKRLDEMGMKRFRTYLAKNGGDNHFYFYSASPASDYIPFGMRFTGITAGGFAPLFAMFEEAGLGPVFLEITGDDSEKFVCGMPHIVMYGVGIHLASGWRVFNMHNHEINAKGDIAYPLNLRQAAGSSRAFERAMDAIISRTPSDADLNKAFSSDGFASSYSAFSDLLVDLTKKGDSESLKIFQEYLKNHRSRLHPVLAQYLDQILSDPKDEGQEPADPQNPRALLLWLLKHADTFDENSGRAIDYANRLLSLDPKCVMAHITLAHMGVRKLLPMSDTEIEDHLAKAMAGLPLNHDGEPSLNEKWGEFYVKGGKIGEARKKFMAALENPVVRDNTRARASYFLALLDPDSAEGFIRQAYDSISKDIEKPGDETSAKDWFDFLKEAEEENTDMHTALKSSRRLSAELSLIWTLVGRALLKAKNFGESIEALNRAKSLCETPDSTCNLALIDFTLHEAHIQSGDLKSADRIFENIAKIERHDPSSAGEGN